MEINKLKQTGAIKEIFYLEWLCESKIEEWKMVGVCGLHRSE